MIPGKHQQKEVQETFIDKMLQKVQEAKASGGKKVALSFDSMHQTHNNENGYEWQEKGKDGTKKMPSNTGRRRLSVLGALNMVSLDVVPFVTEANCDKQTIKIFLKEVKKTYSGAQEISLFLDNARYQRNYEVQEYAKKLRITLEFMPPYSPNLCLIERLWKFFKKKVIKNTYYKTFDEFYEAICTFFRNWDQHLVKLQTLFTLNFEII